jgi:hypothetical protein
MDRTKISGFIFILFIYSAPLLSSERLIPERARQLFPHITLQHKRSEYLAALGLIRLGKTVPPSFFERYSTLSDFYLKAERKGTLETDSEGVGHLGKGESINIPVWVETVTRRNWEVLEQLLQHYPAIVTEHYNGISFEKIVFEAGPGKSIIEKIIKIKRQFTSNQNLLLAS